MKQIAVLALGLAMLAGCGPAAAPGAADAEGGATPMAKSDQPTPATAPGGAAANAQAAVPAVPAGACSAVTTDSWAGGPETLTITGVVTAAACNGEGTVLVTVTNPAGRELLRQETPMDQIFGFDGAGDQAAVREALETLVRPSGSPASTGQLPDWPDGADMPEQSEFPFYLEDGMTQARYRALQAGNRPLLCLIQGRESAGCYILDEGAMVKIGAQSFPG